MKSIPVGYMVLASGETGVSATGKMRPSLGAAAARAGDAAAARPAASTMRRSISIFPSSF